MAQATEQQQTPAQGKANSPKSSKMHRRSRSGKWKLYPNVEMLLTIYRVLYVSTKEEEVLRREASMQSMQKPWT